MDNELATQIIKDILSINYDNIFVILITALIPIIILIFESISNSSETVKEYIIKNSRIKIHIFLITLEILVIVSRNIMTNISQTASNYLNLIELIIIFCLSIEIFIVAIRINKINKINDEKYILYLIDKLQKNNKKININKCRQKQERVERYLNSSKLYASLKYHRYKKEYLAEKSGRVKNINIRRLKKIEKRFENKYDIAENRVAIEVRINQEVDIDTVVAKSTSCAEILNKIPSCIKVVHDNSGDSYYTIIKDICLDELNGERKVITRIANLSRNKKDTKTVNAIVEFINFEVLNNIKEYDQSNTVELLKKLLIMSNYEGEYSNSNILLKCISNYAIKVSELTGNDKILEKAISIIASNQIIYKSDVENALNNDETMMWMFAYLLKNNKIKLINWLLDNYHIVVTKRRKGTKDRCVNYYFCLLYLLKYQNTKLIREFEDKIINEYKNSMNCKYSVNKETLLNSQIFKECVDYCVYDFVNYGRSNASHISTIDDVIRKLNRA